MQLLLTNHGIPLSEKDDEIIKHNLEKLSRFLPHLSPEFSELSLVIKELRHKPHPSKKIEGKGFSGSVECHFDLRLPHQNLQVVETEDQLEFCLQRGFKNLLREVVRYKSTHFEGDSQYPDQRSIRQIETKPEKS